MSARISEPPWGATKIAFAYLGVLLGALGAGLIAGIAYPIITATPVCEAEGGYCAASLTGVVAAVGFAGALFLIAWIMRMGWQWAAWVVVLSLIVVEIAIEANSLWLFVVLLLVPAAASAATWERPESEPPRALRIVRLALLGMGFAQFVGWFVLAVRSAG